MRIAIVSGCLQLDAESSFLTTTYQPEKWSIFSTEGKFEYDHMTRRTKTGYWSVQHKKGSSSFGLRLRQFVDYENQHGRGVLIHTEIQDSEITSILTSPSWPTTSQDRVLVHSTGRQAWDSIKRDNKLIANSYLQTPFRHIDAIESYMRLEPKDYRDYVMLGGVGDNTEVIVASNMAGTFVQNETASYIPGARIYVDAEKLHHDNLLVFDGVHRAKVFREIDLGKYLVRAVSYSEFADRDWTLLDFAAECNRIVGCT